MFEWRVGMNDSIKRRTVFIVRPGLRLERFSSIGVVLRTFVVLVVLVSVKYATTTISFSHEVQCSSSRRTFINRASSAAVVTGTSLLSPFLVEPDNVQAATNGSSISQVIDVSPLAHTFTVSTSAVKGKEPKAKPLRENDATRLLTNARFVLLFDGQSSRTTTIETIIDLTVKRKEGMGAGVTPGKVKLLVPNEQDTLAVFAKGCGAELVINPKATKSSNLKEFATTITDTMSKILDDGDVLFFYPTASHGTFSDGKLISDVANVLNVPVGTSKSGTVVPVLVNGPRSPASLKLVEDGYDTCSVLWYNI